jgi:hypothetical protein
VVSKPARFGLRLSHFFAGRPPVKFSRRDPKFGLSISSKISFLTNAPTENHGIWRAEGVVSLRKKSKKSSKPVKLQIFSNAVLIHKVSKSSNSSSKKKKVAASEAIPLHLCWLNPNPELSEWQLVDSNVAKSAAQSKANEEPTIFYFTLIGPEESYLIGVKSDRERLDWTVVITDCLTQFRANPQNPGAFLTSPCLHSYSPTHI